ncbi:autotransporter domain-containing protein [Roseibacillus persicicus]|uniref:Uncharacterized protein n=1 Tax=Roseibacillus persicicus TaxID=454148 RepID=A0A918TGC3_9BACT|nr:autotransporter domain-containing protein [Roseibacillus persicicus]GHC43918.1 hypothetical protein GCM10007100_06390 [Roseibacillus persicicus]
MKTTTLLSLALAGVAGAGSLDFVEAPALTPLTGDADAFSGLIRPMTNPTLFDLAVPRTQLHFIAMHHQFPNQLNLAGGGQIDFGGDLQLYALQFEYALTERLSIVAMKDGYVDFNPDNTAVFSEEEGSANIGGGLKYAFIYDPANAFAASVSAMFEFPWGSDEVFQGDGDGNINLTLQTVKAWDALQFAAGTGIQIPLDDDFSTQGFLSAHLSYEVHPWFIPLVELNWFYVFDEGAGNAAFSSQAGGVVPVVAPSEGADLLNWGAGSSEDYVTLGVGFRSKLNDNFSLGFCYEFALSDEEDNITKDRFTLDAVYKF